MELNLYGKKAVITGGSKGIGLAIKKALEEEGVEVCSWSRSEGIDLEDEFMNLIRYRQLQAADILINNVGGGGTWDKADSGKIMKKNYGLTSELTKLFLSFNKKSGTVITIGSIYGTKPGPNPYFASAKAAQIMLMKSLAGKYKNITFNCISPAEVADAGTPKKVPLKSEDVANAVVFLCSDKAKFINGQNIVIGEYQC